MIMSLSIESSQWKLYITITEGRGDVYKVFNNNFRVLDIPAYILENSSLSMSLVMCMRPEYTRKYNITHPGDVTREYLLECASKFSEERTLHCYNLMYREIARQEEYCTNVEHEDKTVLTTVHRVDDTRLLDGLKRQYEESVSTQYRHFRLEN